MAKLCNFAVPNEKQDSMEVEQMNPNQKRPTFLTVLCILTFIWSGLTAFSSITFYLFFEQIKVLFTSHPNMMLFGSQIDFKTIFEINKVFFLLQGIFSGLAVAGAFLMWNLKKTGFDLYVIAQLGLVFIPKLFMPKQPFSFQPLIMSAIFVYFYYTQLRYMNKQEHA